MAALAPSRPTEAMPAVVNERNLRRVDDSHFKHMTRSSLAINSIRAAWKSRASTRTHSCFMSSVCWTGSGSTGAAGETPAFQEYDNVAA
jgi:hypothetical protein